MGADRGHGGYGVPLVQRLAPGQDVHAQEAQVMDRALRQVGELHGGLGPIGRGDHRVDPRVGLGGAGVDGFYDCMSVRTAKNLPVKHAGHVGVGTVPGASGYFVGAVVTDRIGADRVKFFVGEDHIGLVLKHSNAPSL